jgi:hypothetical protein
VIFLAIGGSCSGSPTSINLEAQYKGPNVVGCKTCVLSSTIQISNMRFDRCG